MRVIKQNNATSRVLLSALLGGLLIVWPAVVTHSSPAPGQTFDHDHKVFAALLGRYVKAGLVDYPDLARRGRGALDSYLRALGSVEQPQYDDWSRNQRLAFWINAYNASVLGLVLDNYPLSSIQDIGLLPGSAFRRRFVELPGLASGRLSLDDIEHDIIRPRFDEPLAHVALVCAARSCPPLLSQPYRAQLLHEQLEMQARRFLAHPERNRYSPADDTLQLSRIFDWYREDFEKEAGSLLAWLRPRLPGATAEAVSQTTIIRFMNYDWRLNQQ